MMMIFHDFGRICLMFVLLFGVENYVDDFFHRRWTGLSQHNNEAIDQQWAARMTIFPTKWQANELFLGGGDGSHQPVNIYQSYQF